MAGRGSRKTSPQTPDVKFQARIAQMESLLDHAEVGVYSVSVDLKQVLAINPAMEAIFGHSKADFARNPRLWLDLIDPRDLPFIGDPLRDLRMGGKSRHMYRIRRPDGAILWVLDQSHRVDDEQGRPERFDCLFTDITRRRLAEEAFAASEARFRLLAEHAKDVISRHAPDATFLYVSPACRALLGYSAEELIGRSALDFLHPADRIRVRRAIARAARQTNRDIPILLVRIAPKDGREAWAEIAMRARFDPVGNTLREIYLVSRDVTDRVALEAALRESQANLQALIESTDDLIAAYDRELRLLTFNSATAAYHRAVFGIELSAGMSLDECFPLTRVELWRQMLTATLAQGRRQIEMTRADGRLIDLTLSPIARGGQVVGVSAFARDITDRKRSEEVLRSLPKIVMKTQEDERRALARELQDSVIQDLAAMKLALETTHAREHGSASCPCISNVMTSAETILAAVRELASRLRPAIIDDLGLVAAVRSQVQRLAEEQGVKVYVSAELGEGRLRPDLELAGFRIIQEAVGNAVRHGKPREVYVRLAIEEQRLVLAVRDDGCGFNLADAPRRAVVADHLGLSVMRERAALLRGTLEITSAPGRGTEVVARLPIDAD